jgi:hypothetical protein
MTYFVSMTDKFMSGQGGAQYKKAKYVVECDTLAQAEHIERCANYERDEMIYVHLSTKEPKFYPLRSYQVTRKHWNDLGGAWKEGWKG